MTLRRAHFAAIFAFAFALPLTARAGPLDERAAEAHLKAVAAGDVDAVMAQYGDDPWLDWVGGPLDGRYRGAAGATPGWRPRSGRSTLPLP